MSRVVLIDGENLLYGLRKMAGKDEKHAPRDLFTDFPFRTLIEEVLEDEVSSEIFFYGARLRRYDFTEDLLDKTKRAIYLQSKLVNTLKNQGISFIKTGYLRARETEPCPSCEYSEWHLLEKGVDVGLAVRIVEEAAEGNEIVLVSSDTDLLPAVKAARAMGVTVIFVGFDYQPVLALARQASVTRLITGPTVKKYLPKV